MARIIAGLVIGIVAIFIMSVAITMFEPSLDDIKQSDVLNCKNYVDSSDASLSYNASLESNTSACTIVNSTSTFYALAALIGVFMMILYGSGGTPVEPQY